MPAVAGLLFAVCAPGAALAAEDPGGTGVSFRVLPPEEPAPDQEKPRDERPSGYRPIDHADSRGADGVQADVDAPGAASEEDVVRADVAEPGGELPFTGMNGDALKVLALAGAVASIEGVALIVLTRRRFRRAP